MQGILLYCILIEHMILNDYLLQFASKYLKTPVTSDDVVAAYSGVRPLYNDGASSATAATRDYVLKIDTSAGAPLLNVFGGKITTYRKLAESALQQIAKVFPNATKPWTAGVALPGGDFAVDGVTDLIQQLIKDFQFLTLPWATRLIKAYGTEAFDVLADAQSEEDLGQSFGATLSAREVIWLVKNEYARCADDIVWRRSKLGLRLTAQQIEFLDTWMERECAPIELDAGDLAAQGGQ